MRPSGAAPARGGSRIVAAAAVAVGSLCASAAVAVAGGGGVTPPSPPQASDVVCISTCAGVREATAHSKVQISGRRLRHVSRVLFTAKRGGRIRVHPLSASSRRVTAKVPDGAATGRPKVSDSYHNRSRARAVLRIVSPDRIGSSGEFKLKDVSARPHKAYYYGKRPASVTYMFTNSQPTDVRIDVVKRKDGTIVDSWTEQGQEPNTVHKATWNGLTGTRKPAHDGGYQFRIGAESGTMDSTTQAKFAYYGFKFPVRGRHSYGDGVGAPRVGHTHQGQDVLAACGTPLQAARGGRVQYRGYQAGGAGNYLVIDGKKTSHDYVYMHLKRPSRFHKGRRVRTGQQIGKVGATGDATGCHLHMEEWSGPGWYEGGHFMKAITRHLKRWDRWS